MKLYSIVEGNGAPLVFIPGMLATTVYWQKLSDKLKDKFKVIRLDLLGFGKSPAPASIEYSYDDHLQSIEETLADANVHQPIILVGHSMGALLALAFAAKNPTKVKKLILISPPAFKDSEEARHNIENYSALPKILLYGLTAKLTCKIMCQFLRPLTRIGVVYYFKDLPKNIAADTLLHTYYSYSKTLENIVERGQAFEDIKRTRCQTKIIYGALDSRVIPKNLEKLAKINPSIEIIKVENAGHQIPLRSPEIIISSLN